MQRENASCSLNIAPKRGESLFELFCCHLEIHFEVIQEKSAHVDPSTPCNRLQSMLYLCAVSGLVVSRMEAILEHDCFDIVAFLPFHGTLLLYTCRILASVVAFPIDGIP